MPLRFTKMHGLGNDFMVIDAINQGIELNAGQIKRWSDRHFGIGFDQLLLVEAADRDDVDFHYRIFNADGGEVEHCGNGARCFARFVRNHGLSNKDSIPVSTASGILQLNIMNDGRVQVDMGEPDFTPASLPFNADSQRAKYQLAVGGQTITVGVASMGNPHAVMLVDDIDTAPVTTLGPALQSHPDFPNRVNAGFLQIVDDRHVRLRVYERGAGETLACGTGACAAVALGHQWGMLADSVTVELTGGQLQIDWPGPGSSMLMTGPATEVYEGEIEI
jgi:diaminopimelate epimerase